jgi:carbon-monoxide dehydrogenase catalytic subunit
LLVFLKASEPTQERPQMTDAAERRPRVASKDDAVRRTENPAAREMIEHLDACGVETLLDRLQSQQPQCGFGSAGRCCRMCQWGPCRVTAKSPRGVCGRDVRLVAMANLLRAVAAGTSAQTMHARELVLTLLGVARGDIDVPIKGQERLREVGYGLNVAWSWSPPEETAEKVAQVMLEDLGRLTDGRMRMLKAFAPKDRPPAWERLGVLPRSASHEVLEAMHMTTLGGCSDPDAMLRQALRAALAYAYSGLVTSSVVSDILFGVPQPVTAEVNFGVLRPDHVNVLIHGHSPVMVEKVLEKIRSEEIQRFAREKGAAGIVVGGMCCTGHETLARHGIPTVTGAIGQELVLGTGAVDAVVVDMQCVVPGMQAVAQCFGTEIVTTCSSNRIPGATHVPFDPEHPETLDEDAMRVARIAVEAYARRDRSKMHIPSHTTHVMTGFSRESVLNSFGGARKLLAKIAEGDIRGVVAMVGCSTPKVAYETGHVTIARELIRRGVLVLTSGCSALALLNAGLCSPEAARDAAPGLRAACEAAGIPPVLVVGGCSDNTRIVQVFAMLAHEARKQFPEMPFALSGPELSNEKTMGQMMAVLAHGVTSVVGSSPALPLDDAGMRELFSGDGLASMLGSRLLVETDPAEAAATIAACIEEKRTALGWDEAEEAVPAAV